MTYGTCAFRQSAIGILAAYIAVVTTPAFADETLQLVKNYAKSNFVDVDNFVLLQDLPDSRMVTFDATRPASVDETYGFMPSIRQSVYTYLARGEHGRWTVLDTYSQQSLAFHALTMWTTPLPQLAKDLALDQIDADKARHRALLALSTDEVILSHFKDRHSVFEQIADVIHRRAGQTSHFSLSDPQFTALFDTAGLESGDIWVVGERTGKITCKNDDCFTLAIFSRIFTKVGYFHLDPQSAPPAMSPDNYLVIRQLGNGWYFFRQKT